MWIAALTSSPVRAGRGLGTEGDDFWLQSYADSLEPSDV